MKPEYNAHIFHDDWSDDCIFHQSLQLIMITFELIRNTSFAYKSRYICSRYMYRLVIAFYHSYFCNSKNDSIRVLT